MVDLPPEAAAELQQDKYRRKDPHAVKSAAVALGVTFHTSFVSFFSENEGPFGGESTGFELLDITYDRPNIVSQTQLCREVHGFPNRFVVLSDMVAIAVLVLDTESNQVFNVDFEGGDALLKEDKLVPCWESFDEFLVHYFSPRNRIDVE